MDLIKKFKQYQFDELTANGFFFFLLKSKQNIRNAPIIYASKKKPTVKGFDVCEENLQFNDLLKNNIDYSVIQVDDTVLNKKIFIKYFQDNAKYRKQLLRHSWCLLNNFDKNYYVDILSSVSHNNIKEFIKYFNTCFTITEWKTLSVPLNDFHNNYLLKNFSLDETHLFWLNFFKARKSQIKNHNTAPKVAEFLLETFKESKQIKAFFPFFAFLRAKFETIEADIFENEYQYTTVLSLNLKKMFDTFCLTDYSRHSYAEAIKSFMYGVQKFYDLDYVEDVYENKQLGTLHVTFYHNNPAFTFNDGKRLIVDFFNHLKTNHPDNLDSNFVVKWLEFDQLNNSLKTKENIPHQKVKKI